MTVTQFGTGGTVVVTQDSTTGIPTGLTITPDATHGLRYSVTCAGVTQTGSVAAGAAAAVLTLTATLVTDLTDLTVEQI